MPAPVIPYMTLNELTTTASAKLKPTMHIFEAWDGDERERWTNYEALVKWTKENPLDYNIWMEGNNKWDVGTLQGTTRTVTAEFLRYRDNDLIADLLLKRNDHLKKDDRGRYLVRLVAGPFDHSDYGSYAVVPQAELTDQHGSTCFSATDEVLDWGIVAFDEQCAGANVQDSYIKVVQFLLKALED